jgi:type II secretory pathway component PulM
MAEWINQYSLLWIGILVLVGAAALLLRGGAPRRGAVLWVGLALVLVGGWLLLRPQASPVEDDEAVQAFIGKGTPVLLEFQSPY